MSSWNINYIASRFNSVKNTILSSENDGDTEDDTHICRVLRNYYTKEKNQGLPAWLPPDPNAPQYAPVQAVYAPTNVGAGYGGMSQTQASPGGSKALAGLFGPTPSQGREDQQAQSLRARPGGGQKRPNFSAKPLSQQEVIPHQLPSQRNNSYQNTARDKFKQQFTRSASPANPPMQQGRPSYNSASSGGYEDSYGSRGSQGRDGGVRQPAMSANSPWDTGESSFTAGGYRGEEDYGDRRQAQGLPSGPAAGRRGLPSGPRGYR